VAPLPSSAPPFAVVAPLRDDAALCRIFPPPLSVPLFASPPVSIDTAYIARQRNCRYSHCARVHCGQGDAGMVAPHWSCSGGSRNVVADGQTS
jgi:hypothetical protein